jgi:hypothetical protein
VERDRGRPTGRGAQVHRLPRLRAQLRLERGEAAEVVERRGQRARHAEEGRDVAGERREAERDAVVAARSRGAHRRVDEQLDRAVRRVGRAQEVLDEQPAAREHRHRRAEPDDGAGALGDEQHPFVGEPERLELHEEAHRRHPLSGEPGLRQRVDRAMERRRGIRDLARRHLAHGHALLPGAAQLVAQRPCLRVGEHRVPLGGLPHRLLADRHRRAAQRVDEPLLAREEARAAAGILRRRREVARDVREPVGRRDRRAARDPRRAGVDVRDERVTREPVAEVRLEQLERHRRPPVVAEQVERALAVGERHAQLLRAITTNATTGMPRSRRSDASPQCSTVSPAAATSRSTYARPWT